MEVPEPHTPDHVKDGKTLPQQIEGDHAYRDEPPEHDPSLWASCKLTCLACGAEYPAAPAGERAERLRSGQIDVGPCPECERDTPAVDASKVDPLQVHVVTHTDGYTGQTYTSGAYLGKDSAEERAEEFSYPKPIVRTEHVSDWVGEIGNL